MAHAREGGDLFKDTDLYTVIGPQGERLLDLEHGLSSIESRFGQLRKEKLAPLAPLSDEDMDWLLLFVAAAHVRTPAMRQMRSGETGAKAQVTYDFKDPASAQWRNLYFSEGKYVDGSALRALCGEVNGKNSYGAYVGFRPFYTLKVWKRKGAACPHAVLCKDFEKELRLRVALTNPVDLFAMGMMPSPRHEFDGRR